MLINIKYDKPEHLKSVKQSAYIKFNYNKYIVDTIRMIYPRYYDVNARTWEIPYDYVSYLQENLSKYNTFNIIGKPISEKKYNKKEVKEYTLPKQLKTKLYDYQKDVFNECMTYNRYLLLLETGCGKAQPLYSKLLTANGYVNMQDIKVGDKVFGDDGQLHEVLGVFPQGYKDVYEITLSDKTKCRCSDEHLWTVYNVNKHREETITVNDMLNYGLYRFNKHKKGTFKKWMFKLPYIEPINFDKKEVPIDPWVFGMLIGDGSFREGCVSISLYEKDSKDKMLSKLKLANLDLGNIPFELGGFNICHINGKYNALKNSIKDLGLFGHRSEEKFIPDIYKYNSYSVRLELLRGLFDSGGTIQDNSTLSYSTSSKQLAYDVQFLVQSFGGTCSISEKERHYTYNGERKEGLNSFDLYIKMPEGIKIFTSDKHNSRCTKKQHVTNYRIIRDIKYIGKEPCQCIYIDSESHLYLTDNLIPTHNTVVTQTSLIKHKELNHINNVLIIVCVSGLKYTWQNEFKKHFNMNAKVLGDRLNRKGYYEVKKNEDKLYDLKHLDKDNYIYITNIESLRDKKILEELKKLFKKGIFDCLVVDECHKVKSSGSIQGKALLSLSKYTKYMYELTGTIITNSPIDLYVPLKCMQVEESNFNSFKNHYCTMGGFGGYQIVGYKHMDELQSKLLSCSVRLRKEDVLDLPDKVYIDEYVEMGTRQRKLYEDVKKAIVDDIDAVMLSVNPLSQLIRLRQASTDTSILSTTVKESAKYDRALELIKDIVDENKSVVVFSELATVIDNFYKILPYKKVAKVTGTTKDREQQINMFMSDDDCHIILGTEALQTGYTLTKANTVIFLDEPWTAAQREQAESRIYRLTQNSSVNIITLMCKNSIDEYIHNLISRKAVVSDALIDNKYNIKDKDVINYIITGEGSL